MTLSSKYIVASDLESIFVNKDTGLVLANGTLKFYRDVERNQPKEVFELSGLPGTYTFTSIGDTVTLSNSGTVQDAGGNNIVIYWYPWNADDDTVSDKYYVVVSDENGNVQFTRGNWPPNSEDTGPTPPPIDSEVLENQLANTTFSNVFLNPDQPTVLTLSADINKVCSGN